MPGEDVTQLLRSLTGVTTGEDERQVYALYAGLTVSGGETLEQLVRLALTANGKTSQLRESLGATLAAGGAIGETTEEKLRNTGLLGFS